jgi:predicted transcriptional regulator
MGRLPSLDTLRVFSIAARHMSFTKAADELHLTQSAISHRVSLRRPCRVEGLSADCADRPDRPRQRRDHRAPAAGWFKP